MPSKKQILLESIRKLLSMNVSEEEIVTNLADVGVSKPEALTLIKEARKPAKEPVGDSRRFERFFKKLEKTRAGEKAAPAKKEKPAPQGKAREPALPEKATMAEEIMREVVKPAPSKGAIAEEIAQEIGAREKPAAEKPAVEKKPAPPAGKKPSAKEEKAAAKKLERKIEGIDLGKLWEKGILTTVNQRLQEMKGLREELDKVLDKKVQEAAKRENEKMKVLFDSQRTLLVSKVDAEIEAKGRAFAQMIEAKLHEMRETSTEIEESVEKLRAERKKRREEEADLVEKLEELKAAKQQLVAQMNSELIKEKTQLGQFLDQAKEKLQDMDNRVNKTLQLESQIVEGLAKDAGAKIEERLEGKATGLDKETLAELQDFKTSKGALEQQIKEKLLSLERLQQAVKKEYDPARLKQQAQELEEFRQQFIKAIEYNVKKFNAAIKRLNAKSAEVENQLSLRIKKIDGKIAELDAFEKNFAKEMGIVLDKLTAKKKA